jgi:hypothetical protein
MGESAGEIGRDYTADLLLFSQVALFIGLH